MVSGVGKQTIFRDDSDVLQMGSTNNTNSTTDTATGGGATTSVDDAYNRNLVYTGDDVLAMAKSGDDQDNSQFFITNKAERGWDFRYTILGVMTEGDAFRQTIAALPTTTNATTGLLQPDDPVVIDSVSLVADTTNGVLELSAPTSSIGKQFTVNIVISDGTPADSVTVPLTVTVAQDPTPPPPFLLTPNSSSSVSMVSGGSASLNLTAYVPAGATAQFANASNVPGDGSVGFTAFNATTGQTTVTAASNFAGQTEVLVGVNWPSDTTNSGSYDSQYVPVFVTPTAPSLGLTTPTVSGTTAVKINQGIVFSVSGVFSGATVKLFADGKLVGSATAATTSGALTSVSITTNSGATFTDGQHVFTATQEVSGAVANVPNRSDKFDLVSAASTLNVIVATKPVLTVDLPSTATQFTLRKNGANLQVVADSSGAVAFNQPLSAMSGLQIVGAADKAEQLTVNFAYGGAITLPLGVSFTAGAGTPADSLIVDGANVANTFNLNGTTLSADGLAVNFTGVKKIQIDGGTASDSYTLVSSPANLTLVDSGGTNTLDFSHDTAGIALNLGLGAGQAQRIAPWGKTLSLQGVFQNVVGTPYRDVLIGGAGIGIIRGGGGNDVLMAGTGNTVLVNGSGDSTLVGGPGTCLLIAGSGTSTLLGGSGLGMLVGGATAYDANDQALLSILASIPQDPAFKNVSVPPVSKSPSSPSAPRPRRMSVRPSASTGPTYTSLVMGKTVTDSGNSNTLIADKLRTIILPGAKDVVLQSPAA